MTDWGNQMEVSGAFHGAFNGWAVRNTCEQLYNIVRHCKTNRSNSRDLATVADPFQSFLNPWSAEGMPRRKLVERKRNVAAPIAQI